MRRLEAVAGAAALAHVEAEEEQLARAAEQLKTRPADINERIAALLEERKRQDQEIAKLRKQLATGGGSGAEVQEINGTRFLGRVLDGVPAKELRGMADELKKQIGSGVVTIVAISEGKAAVVVGVTKDIADKYSAVELVRVASAALGGKGGGGRPDMAQAGGPDGDKADAAIRAVADALAA